MKFHSKIDLAFGGLMLVLIAIIVSPVFFLEQGTFFWVYVAFAILMVVWFVTLSFFNSYTFEEKHLVIKSGFFKMRLNYSLIINAKVVKNLKLSFASSLERIELSFGASRDSDWNRIYISPSKQEEFFKELKKHCPELTNN